MKTKLTKILSMLLAAVLCLSLLSACGGSNNETTPAAQDPSASQTPQTLEPPKADVKYKDTVRIGVGSDIANGEYYQVTNTMNGIAKMTYDCLWEYDYNEAQPKAELAKEWSDVNGDGKTWKVTIQQGVKFHDTEGKFYDDLTTKDVKFTFEYCSPNAEVKVVRTSAFAGQIESMDIVDDYTMIFHMNTAIFDFPLQAGTCIISEKAVKEMGTPGEEVGSGPFYINYPESQYGIKRTLTRYDDYWKGIDNIPTKNIVFYVLADASTRCAALEADEIDLDVGVGNENMAVLEDAGFTVSKTPASNICFIHFNGYAGAIFSNPDDPNQKKLRQAIQYGIDKDALVTILYGAYPGSGVRLDSVIGKFTNGYVDLGQTEFSLKKAKTLMEELGYNANNRLHLVLAHYSSYTAYATVVQDMLKNIYIDVELNTMDSSNFGVTVRTGRGWDILVNYYGTAPSFITDLGKMFQSSGSLAKSYGWNSPEMDKKINEILSKPSFEEQLAAFKEFQTYLRDVVPFVATHVGSVVDGMRADLEGYIPYPTGGAMVWEFLRIPEK